MSSPFGGGKNSGSSMPSSSQGLSPESYDTAGGLTNLAAEETGYAQTPLAGGQGQYEAGLTGQMTPAQQASVAQTLQQMNLGTAGNYANLNLGGSTMAQQDMGANQLSSLAQQQQFDTTDEQLGLQAMGLGSSMLGGAGGLLGQAGGIYGQGTSNNLAGRLGSS